MPFKTEQEAFWAGDFGVDYIGRNRGDELLASNLDFFGKALRQARGLASCIEFGANIGMNLRALKLLHPAQEQFGIEINPEAARQLAEFIPKGNVSYQSILDTQLHRVWDLALIKGVLIHISPDQLGKVYDQLFAAAARYVCVVEYYNPSPVSLSYRGHSDRLFKRDFAGEIMDRHPDLDLVDYGFVYRRDPNFPQDDINWFLMERRHGRSVQA
jgi:pseudaminic acid biosynthesis-associated methylase